MSLNSYPLAVWKHKVAEHVAKASGLSIEDASSILEEKLNEEFEFAIPMQKIKKFKIQEDPAKVAADWASKIVPDEYLQAAKVSSQGEGKKAITYLNFYCHKAPLLKAILSTVFEQDSKYGQSNDLSGQKILVEFSSPNIAKPFHAGHLRSTIIGNFLKNLYTKLGADVTAINYLGDWGTQYGILALGFKDFGNEADLQADPIKHLFNVYVAANKKVDGDATADPPVAADPAYKQSARDYFKLMEDGDEQALGLWKRFRELSIGEYKKVYHRLNVDFDVYSGESEQTDGMQTELAKMEAANLLQTDDKGAKRVQFDAKTKIPPVLIQKSDGATLYITRDIAAAKARHDKYQFDKSIYVVSNQQDLHFIQLFKLLELMGYDWAKKCEHVNFGLVKGMSTRKGNVVFLDDILNEANEAMLKKMMEDKMGKLAEIENPEETSDIIGLSAVIVQDMMAKRGRDYEFDWKRILSFEGQTGPYLQYTHARLCSIEDKTASVPISIDIDATLLAEPQARALAMQIANFPFVLRACTHNQEPSSLVAYLFELTHAISAANSVLKVKDQEIKLATARKLLYWAGKVVLSAGLELIGLTPLKRI